MLLPLLGSAAVGGLIGYTTNWLAIKMLFWPLEERRLGRWRVPFTPGLIPKKREKLAESLGETVANYLVTEDTLAAALAAPEFAEHLQQTMQAIWVGLRVKQQTVGELLQTTGYLPTVEQLTDRLTATVLPALRSAAGQQMLGQTGSDICSSLITGLLERMQAEQVDPSDDRFARALRDFALQDAWSGQLAEWVRKTASPWLEQTAPLGELLPAGTKEELRSHILNHGPDWLDRLQSALRSPNSLSLIKRLIKDFLSTNPMLKVLATFADLDRIAESVPDLLAKDEVRMRAILLMLEALDKLWEQPLCELSSSLLPTGLPMATIRSWLDQWLSGETLPRVSRSLFDWLCRTDWRESGSGLRGALTPLLAQLQPWWSDMLQAGLNSSQTTDLVRGLIKRLLHMLLDLPVDRVLPELSGEQLIAARDRVHQLLTGLIERHGQELLASLQLPQVVEAQVNALDVVEVEEILLRVMREQLRAITNLGFVLGAAIGLAMPFLNSWLSAL